VYCYFSANKINLIEKLLSVKFHKGQISLFCEPEVDFMIWFLGATENASTENESTVGWNMQVRNT